MHIFVRNNSSSWGKQKWRGANISGSAEDGPGDSTFDLDIRKAKERKKKVEIEI